MTYYKKHKNGDTLVMSVARGSYGIASKLEPEPEGYPGSPDGYAGWEEITAAEASQILGWDVTA